MLLPVEYFEHDPHHPRALTPAELDRLKRQKARQYSQWLAAHDQTVNPPRSGTPRHVLPLARIKRRKQYS